MLNLNSPLCLHRLERKRLLGFLEKTSRTVEEQLAAIALALEHMWKNKDERIKEISDVQAQIRKICGEIAVSSARNQLRLLLKLLDFNCVYYLNYCFYVAANHIRRGLQTLPVQSGHKRSLAMMLELRFKQRSITEIKPLELKLKFSSGLHGRIHITEASDGNVSENPFSNYKIGQATYSKDRV
ncbi:putative microtubule-associated protein, MAP65/Ase1/PRC1 [Helianthus annuus]|nr:putative microtubule-associated protein, MAP65/Ase1/PRC1 [Helianthus annuus]